LDGPFGLDWERSAPPRIREEPANELKIAVEHQQLFRKQFAELAIGVAEGVDDMQAVGIHDMDAGGKAPISF
jgi:hypothetical protein